MLIGIEGGLGSGKTIKLVDYLLTDKLENNRPIMCNLKSLSGIDYYYLDVVELLKYTDSEKDLNNITVGIDELTVYVDCRVSAKKGNRIFSYLVLQSRKRGVDIYYTTQDFNLIDWRVIAHTHINILAESLYDENNNEIDGLKRYTIIDLRNRRNPKVNSFLQDVRAFYNSYDTDEIIVPDVF